jgi:hypothetical protein
MATQELKQEVKPVLVCPVKATTLKEDIEQAQNRIKNINATLKDGFVYRIEPTAQDKTLFNGQEKKAKTISVFVSSEFANKTIKAKYGFDYADKVKSAESQPLDVAILMKTRYANQLRKIAKQVC